MVSSTYQTLKAETINFGWYRNWKFTVSLCSTTAPQKKADAADIYFTSLDAAGISPTHIMKQTAQAKERGSWVPLKIWMSEAAKAVQTE